MSIPAWRAWAGGLLLIGCLQYPIAELLTAAAWRSPPYSFTANYISDLGSLACGPLACSPLAWVMNAAFVTAGLLAIASMFLLAPLLPPGWRLAVIVLVLLHGLGTIGVGLVPSAPHAAAGTPPVHFAAATAAILAGNLALGALAAALARAGAPLWLWAPPAALGIFGLCSALLLVTVTSLPTGLIERMAADTITPTETLMGVSLLVAMARSRAADAITIARLRSAGASRLAQSAG